MATKPSIPKGTRDFSPEEMAKRNYIFNTIREVFHLFGFQQIETPAMENLSTLMGKYGEEGDKLLFKVLNSGDFLSDVSDDELTERNTNRLASKLARKVCVTTSPCRLPVRGDAPGRVLIPFQTLPDTARMAGRPAAERSLPRVFPMRCRCCRVGFPPERSRTAAPCR